VSSDRREWGEAALDAAPHLRVRQLSDRAGSGAGQPGSRRGLQGCQLLLQALQLLVCLVGGRRGALALVLLGLQGGAPAGVQGGICMNADGAWTLPSPAPPPDPATSTRSRDCASRSARWQPPPPG